TSAAPLLLSGLRLRRINPKKRDDKVDAKIGHEIVVRLAAARCSGSPAHGEVRVASGVLVDVRPRPHRAGGRTGRTARRLDRGNMSVSGNLGHGQRDGL